MSGENSFLGEGEFNDSNLVPRCVDQKQMREKKTDFCRVVCIINVVKLQMFWRAEHLREISIKNHNGVAVTS